jgi:hypothetical protein
MALYLNNYAQGKLYCFIFRVKAVRLWVETAEKSADLIETEIFCLDNLSFLINRELRVRVR